MKSLKYLIGSAILTVCLAVTGCGNESIEKRIEKYHDSKQTELCKAGSYICGKVKGVKENEFIIPRKVMSIYDKYNKKTTSKDEIATIGLFRPESASIRNEYKMMKELKKEGYSASEIELFMEIFNRDLAIIVDEKLLFDDKTELDKGIDNRGFEHNLAHERFHRAMYATDLSIEELTKLDRYYKKSTEMLNEDFKKQFYIPNFIEWFATGYASDTLDMMFNMDGKHSFHTQLEKKDPETYKIYAKIRERIKK